MFFFFLFILFFFSYFYFSFLLKSALLPLFSSFSHHACPLLCRCGVNAIRALLVLQRGCVCCVFFFSLYFFLLLLTHDNSVWSYIYIFVLVVFRTVPSRFLLFLSLYQSASLEFQNEDVNKRTHTYTHTHTHYQVKNLMSTLPLQQMPQKCLSVRLGEGGQRQVVLAFRARREELCST